jgi:replicative DNA helicase
LTPCSCSFLLRAASKDRRQKKSRKFPAAEAVAKHCTFLIVLSQFKPRAGTREKRKHRLWDLSESGSIEQDAAVVGLLYKPTAYND